MLPTTVSTEVGGGDSRPLSDPRESISREEVRGGKMGGGMGPPLSWLW